MQYRTVIWRPYIGARIEEKTLQPFYSCHISSPNGAFMIMVISRGEEDIYLYTGKFAKRNTGLGGIYRGHGLNKLVHILYLYILYFSQNLCNRQFQIQQWRRENPSTHYHWMWSTCTCTYKKQISWKLSNQFERYAVHLSSSDTINNQGNTYAECNYNL